MEFIIDKNVDIEPHQAEYPDYFFNSLKAKGKATLVIGGSEYNAGIMSKTKLLLLINQLSAGGKVRRVPDADVDAFQRELVSKIKGVLGVCPAECDDHHIFTLAKIGKCLNIITKEIRMASCRDKIRGKIGHDFCPSLKVIRTEAAFNDLWT